MSANNKIDIAFYIFIAVMAFIFWLLSKRDKKKNTHDIYDVSDMD